jgi:hypothetical protein
MTIKYELQQVAKVSRVDGPWTAELNERFKSYGIGMLGTCDVIIELRWT